MPSNLSRRAFLKSTAALSALGVWPGFGRGALGAALAPAPRSSIRPRRVVLPRHAKAYTTYTANLSFGCGEYPAGSVTT